MAKCQLIIVANLVSARINHSQAVGSSQGADSRQHANRPQAAGRNRQLGDAGSDSMLAPTATNALLRPMTLLSQLLLGKAVETILLALLAMTYLVVISI